MKAGFKKMILILIEFHSYLTTVLRSKQIIWYYFYFVGGGQNAKIIHVGQAELSPQPHFWNTNLMIFFPFRLTFIYFDA